jgi:hypothetical protein
MANTDLSRQFEKISDKAKAATGELRAAGQQTRDQLAAEAAIARDKATAAADQFRAKADGARDKASSQWHDIRGKWQAHVAQVRTTVEEKKERFDAREAAKDADRAEVYALDAIDFAQATIQEAESATLDALYLRANADALRT